MVDIVLKLTKEEVEVSDTPDTIDNCVLFRIYSPSISKITVTDEDDVILGSMTMPAGFVEIMNKRFTDTLTATEPVFCTPLAWK
jgi:hypothetical protein